MDQVQRLEHGSPKVFSFDDQPGDGHRLRQLNSIPSQHGQLTKGGASLVLSRPLRDRDPVILKVKVAGVKEKAGQLSLGLDVKVGELDHRHFGAGLSFELMNVV